MLKIIIPKNWSEKPPTQDKFQHWSDHMTEITQNLFSHTSEHISCTPTLVQLAEEPKPSVIHFEKSWSHGIIPC